MELPWSKEEIDCLKQLHLDPVQDSPEKLVGLVKHFRGPRPSVFAITEGGKEPHVSKDLARKVRDLTDKGRLDWILHRHPDDGKDGLTLKANRELVREDQTEQRSVMAVRAKLKSLIDEAKSMRERGTRQGLPPPWAWYVNWNVRVKRALQEEFGMWPGLEEFSRRKGLKSRRRRKTPGEDRSWVEVDIAVEVLEEWVEELTR